MENEHKVEAKRLYERLKTFGVSEETCLRLAPVTLEINRLKKETKTLILAHSYQTADIIYGVADAVGDSYGLAKKARETDAERIVFSSVFFMGETAKILNPDKHVYVPHVSGCSLADSITATDVQKLRKQYPNAGFVAYVNTSAEVKAEVDSCCTSSNALKIVEGIPQEEIVFLPDVLMGQNLQKHTKKKLHLWNGTCIVHESFGEKKLQAMRKDFPKAAFLAHPECTSPVVDQADFIGSTEQMIDYAKASDKEEFLLLTECGLVDRAKEEVKQKRFVGTCSLCPYMKQITIYDILDTLRNFPREKEIVLSPEIIAGAQRSLDQMFALAEQ